MAPLAIALTLLCGAAGEARAQWDLSGDVGTRETWSQNTTFSSQPGSGDAISTIRLSGRALRTGPRFNLDAMYAPDAQFYRDHSNFNHLNHTSRMTGSFGLSERDALIFSGNYFFTPAQGVTEETFQTPILFTHFTDRRQGSESLGLRHSLTERTDLVFNVRNYFQTFSDPSLTDSIGYGVGASVHHKLSPDTSYDVGVGNGWNRFLGTQITTIDPNGVVRHLTTDGSTSEVASVFSGVSRKIGDRLIVSGRLGYNLATPGDPNASEHRGALVQGSLTWSGTRLTSYAGYSRDLYTGSGALELSETETVYGNVSYKFTQTITGGMVLNRTVSRRVGSGAAESARAFNGNTSIRYRFTSRLEASAGFSRYIQSAQRLNAPDLTLNSYSIGLVAAFD